MPDYTLEQLKEFKGEGDAPVYFAVKGVIYDATPAKHLYGPGGSYHKFAGCECSRALALMKVEESMCNDDLADLTEKDLKVLEDWIKKFETKYEVVGKVIK
ncbi:hypothetical protein BSKO_05443 [Bryopsis sp. KO-2023]|nr:hypothetical protein BSKO_05443 [Bryopsis sp. KO-2023]